MRYKAIPVLLAAVLVSGCASQERRPAPQTTQPAPAAVSVSTETAVLQAPQPPKPAEAPSAPAAVEATTTEIKESPAEAAPEARRMHKVWINESLWSIAKKYYGDGNMWTLIYEANKDQIVSPRKIFPKQMLVIPENGN